VDRTATNSATHQCLDRKLATISLALFSVPVVVLEPVKPVGALLFAQGRVVEGALTICAGEILKITLVERLFRLTRDRLMQIPVFAMLYGHWIRFHDWVMSTEIWRWARDEIARLKLWFRRSLARVGSRQWSDTFPNARGRADRG
jgi:hypothetical protein